MTLQIGYAVGLLSPMRDDCTRPLLPPVADSRKVSQAVAEAVGRQAIVEGVADLEDPATLRDMIRTYMWEPVYLPYERIS